MVSQTADLGRCRDRANCGFQRPGGAAETLALRALTLVQAAARWTGDGAADVRGYLVHGQGQRSAGCAYSDQSVARSVRRADRFLRLSAAGADSRSVAHSRIGTSPHSTFQISAAS